MDHNDLKKLFDENPNKKQSGLALALGRDPAVMNRMVKGAVKIKSDDIPVILNFFNKGVHIDGVGGAVYTIDEAELNLNDKNNKVLSQWQIPTSYFEDDIKSEAINIIRVKGDAMSPEINSGDRVLIDTNDVVPSPSGLFVLCDNSGYLIRRCETIINSKPVKIEISASNPSYKSNNISLKDIKIIGRVISHIRKL